MSGDVAAFIRARLDEDGQSARAASRDGETWAYTGTGVGVYVDGANHPVAVGPWDGELPDEGPHIARHDPARVLRQAEAMRRVAQRCTEELADASHWTTVESCDEDGAILAGEVLRALASIWSDHPEYQEGWAT